MVPPTCTVGVASLFSVKLAGTGSEVTTVVACAQFEIPQDDECGLCRSLVLLVGNSRMRVAHALGAPVVVLAHLGLGRAHALQGETVKARMAYQDFFALWKDADPDIPILKQAKAEYAKLQ